MKWTVTVPVSFDTDLGRFQPVEGHQFNSLVGSP